MKKVYIIGNSPYGGFSDLTLAIANFARSHGGWLIRQLPLENATPRYLRQHPPDGMLVCPDFSRQLRLMGKLRLPTIVIAINLRAPEAPGSVCFDEQLIGKLAAEHLLERRYERFFYLGVRSYWAADRAAGFIRRIQAAGHPVSSNRDAGKIRWPTWEDLEVPGYFEQCAMALPVHCGVMVCNDEVARRFISACGSVGRKVPQEIAVIGVNNDKMNCEFGEVPSSSVDPDIDRLGAEAGAALDKLMTGQPIAPGPIFVPPRGIVIRRSSDQYATSDEDVLSALTYIRENPREVNIARLISAVSLSRATLERRFRAALGHSPAKEIRRYRLELARQLLLHDDRPLADIAEACGFQYLSNFSACFTRAFKQNPSGYRAQSRLSTVITAR
jgi:LacI family transcriptional regulator